jgi:hypothetical protein
MTPSRSLPAALVAVLAAAASACAGGGPSAMPATTAVAPTTATATAGPPTTAVPGRPASTAVPPTTAAAGGAGGGVHAVDWANTTYPADACGFFGESKPTSEIVVRNGTSGTWETGGADAGTGVVYGDLTGDGNDEAVVPLFCRTGGSMKWSRAWLYTGDSAAPGGVRRLDRVEVDNGEGPTIDARYFSTGVIADRHLTTTWTTYAATDPNNVPTLTTTLRQHWNGSALVNDAPPAVGPGDAG